MVKEMIGIDIQMPLYMGPPENNIKSTNMNGVIHFNIKGIGSLQFCKAVHNVIALYSV